jgi:hypothetical protein
MSLSKMITKIEEERAMNQTLLEKLLLGLDEEIRHIEEKKTSLREEFNERDRALLRLVDENA